MYIRNGGVNMGLILQKWGNSNAIRLPKTLLDELDWKSNQELDFLITEEGLTLKPTKKLTIENLFAGFEGRIEEKELDWGQAQGSEVW